MPAMGNRGPAAERAKDFKGTIRKLVIYIAHERIALIIAIVCAIASVVFNVLGPRILGQATTELFNGLAAKVMGTGSIDFAKIGYILAGLLCLYITAALMNFVQGWLMTGITQRVCYRMRKEIVQKIDRMPLSYFETNSVGDVMSRVTNDVDTLGQSLNQSVTQLITSVTQLIGVAVMMVSVSIVLAGLTFLTVPVSLLLVIVVVRRNTIVSPQERPAQSPRKSPKSQSDESPAADSGARSAGTRKASAMPKKARTRPSHCRSDKRSSGSRTGASDSSETVPDTNG